MSASSQLICARIVIPGLTRNPVFSLDSRLCGINKFCRDENHPQAVLIFSFLCVLCGEYSYLRIESSSFFAFSPMISFFSASVILAYSIRAISKAGSWKGMSEP